MDVEAWILRNLEAMTQTMASKARPKIIIGHPYLGRGGSEARVMWLIECLKSEYDLTVVTTGGWQLDELNHAYNTHVEPEDAEVLIAPLPPIIRNRSVTALRNAYYQRFCRSIAHAYDLCISAYNVTDWGREAIHFIADLSWSSKITSKATGRSPGFVYRDTPLRRMYLGFAQKTMRPSGRDPLRQDVLLPTSRWGAAILKQEFGSKRVEALYPFLHSPAQNEINRESLIQSEVPFLSLGRIAVEKRIEDTIAILSRVRNKGVPIRLHLAGQIGTDPYGRKIQQLCNENSGWITVNGRVSGARKRDLFNSVAFGISTCRQELFGNAVAEMMCGGIIPFVCAEGGPAELVHHPALTFSNQEDAVEKIIRVVQSADLRTVIRSHLVLASQVFSLDATIDKVRQIVHSALESQLRVA